MADSGVPGVSQVAKNPLEALGAVGGALTGAGALGGIAGGVVGHQADQAISDFTNPKIPKAAAAPAVASGTNPETAKAMQDAQEDPTLNRKRGQAANMLAGISGGSLTGSSGVSRNILLGS